MYAIVKAGGHQEKVEVGDVILVNRLDAKNGETVEFPVALVVDGEKVIIAAAGKAAHLGGVVAAYTPDPVIAVPMKTSDLGGLDSLLSMVQMPSGVPVATVAINGAKNAAILAVQIMGTGCDGARQKIIDMKKAMAEA